MDNTEEALEPQVETEPVTETTEVSVDTSALTEQLEKEKEARRQLTARAAKAEAERKAALEQLERARKEGGTVPLGVDDYINISTALDGLDQREKARLAEEHRNSGKPLKEIRESEDFQLWQSAYRAKVEAENALKPSSTQAVEEGPQTLTDRLKTASLEEKEAILAEAGLWRSPRPKADKVDIGKKLSY